MDLAESSANGKMIETTASNEDMLVVIQTESGEQIALPMSALPSDFVPGDSGQIIMVESTLDEQQEVVVESEVNNLEPSLQPLKPPSSPVLLKTPFKTAEAANHNEILETQLLTANTTITTITTETTAVEVTATTPTTPTIDAAATITTIVTPTPPRTKQKRKETIQIRDLNEEDIELKFQIIEEPLVVPEVEVKRKPRKEYRTKKRARLEKLSKGETEEVEGEEEAQVATTTPPESPATTGQQQQAQQTTASITTQTKKDREKDKDKDSGREDSDQKDVKEGSGRKQEQPKRELSRRVSMRDKLTPSNKTQEQPQPQPQHQPSTPLFSTTITEGRRTRLSNACRVATGKSYKCTDCDFSTDRINNIILHVKESCPKLKRT